MQLSSKILTAIAFTCTLSPNGIDAHRIHRENFAPAIAQRFISNVQHFLPERLQRHLKWKPRSVDMSANSAFPYLTAPSHQNHVEIAKQFVIDQLQLQQFGGERSFAVKNAYTSKHNGVTHVYLKQLVDGLEVENGDVNVNVDKLGRVVSWGESFYKPKGGQKKRPPVFVNQASDARFSADEDRDGFDGEWISASEAVKSFAKFMKLPIPEDERIVVKSERKANGEEETKVLGFSFVLKNGIPVKQKFLQVPKPDGTTVLEPVWDVQAEMDDNWYHAHVSAKSGEVIGLMDWVSDAATYNVYPIGVNDPEDGNRTVVVDPADKEASPLGWHSQDESDKSKQYTTTVGNNVFAQENLDGTENDGILTNYRPDGGESLSFDFPLDLTDAPGSYLDSAVTNLFYWNNVMHDVFYKYGFDEESGNFQQNNFDRGGRENDAVIANAQDGSGYNNANFATPPDGMNGKMRMYVWNTKKPYRDGDLEAGIIIHEYAHGISTRLTGGPANSGCLGWGEAGGMGEGWGDFFATALRMRPEYTREMNFPMGAYSMGDKKGIRKYVYSTSLAVNPSTYGFIKKFAYIGVHAKGEVWAAMLYELYWNLVDKHGFSKDWYNPTEKKGNQIALQLVVDGMKFQPCRPSFIDARDAILQADETNYDGEHVCDIWKAFAKRGLGVGARSGGHESFNLPHECDE